MTYAQSLAAAQRLKAIMNKHGVQCSIELVADVDETYNVLDKRGIISHHTATHDYQGLTPALGLVKRGRAGLEGPLANGYGGRDLVYRILTMGKANHAGLGGPLTLAAYIPKNYGNRYTWGTEYEGGYEQWTPQMREFMGRANAALCEYFGWNANSHGEHRTWTSRKIDRLNYSTQDGRNEIVQWGGAGGSVTPVPNNPQPVGTSPWKGKNPNAQVTPGSRTVHLYDAGTDVQFIQERIGSTKDGWYGADSVAKAKVWQKKNGLVPDGIIGPKSWAVLLGAPKPPAANLAKDGNLLLDLDGDPGGKTYARLQQVMGTYIDGKVSNPSPMWEAVQHYLNQVVQTKDIQNLTGKPKLDEDGRPGTKTIKVLQFLLFNWYGQKVLGRGPRIEDFDGIAGENTWKLFQHALNNAVAGSKRF